MPESATRQWEGLTQCRNPNDTWPFLRCGEMSMPTSNNPRLWYFRGGNVGQFAVRQIVPVVGAALPTVTHLDVSQGTPESSAPPGFLLKGVVSHERYSTRQEKSGLVAVQQALGRGSCTFGAFIPIKKSPDWWALSQDERRAIFEDRSAHIALGLRALPAIARRLHHCRDLEEESPFDFLTWFDFTSHDQQQFDDLLGALRATEEWRYVIREVEVRVTRT